MLQSFFTANPTKCDVKGGPVDMTQGTSYALTARTDCTTAKGSHPRSSSGVSSRDKTKRLALAIHDWVLALDPFSAAPMRVLSWNRFSLPTNVNIDPLPQR